VVRPAMAFGGLLRGAVVGGWGDWGGRLGVIPKVRVEKGALPCWRAGILAGMGSWGGVTLGGGALCVDGAGFWRCVEGWYDVGPLALAVAVGA